MSEQGRKRQRSGELRRVRCRVCREELNFQSYSDHIKALHPEEDPRDRREFGQAKLFGGVMVKKVTKETSQEETS